MCYHRIIGGLARSVCVVGRFFVLFRKFLYGSDQIEVLSAHRNRKHITSTRSVGVELRAAEATTPPLAPPPALHAPARRRRWPPPRPGAWRRPHQQYIQCLHPAKAATQSCPYAQYKFAHTPCLARHQRTPQRQHRSRREKRPCKSRALQTQPATVKALPRGRRTRTRRTANLNSLAPVLLDP